jgi:hypothetical protein
LVRVRQTRVLDLMTLTSIEEKLGRLWHGGRHRLQVCATLAYTAKARA